MRNKWHFQQLVYAALLLTAVAVYHVTPSMNGI